MRSVVCGLLLIVLSNIASVQSQVDPPAQKEPQAKEVTIDDLQGMTIHTSNSFAARFRNARGEASGGFTLRRQIKIGPGAAVQLKAARDAWWDGPNGRKTGHLTRTSAGTIGLPIRRKDGGAALLLLENNTLTLLRVLETGGTTLRIDFKKGATSLNCVAVAAVAREVGAGATKDQANEGDDGGGKIQVLSARPTAASCKVQGAQ